MDEQVNPLDRDYSLSVVLPGGLEKHATVHGSKPVMDLLVTLCANYHLNPSDYTVEVLSPNKNIIRFKPNSPIGSLEADKIVLKPKAMEEKIRRPYMPEPSVRLLINYNKSHKAVVRVNPQVPIELLMPAVCEKCEFQVETTVLLRDARSKEVLDLTKSLNDHGVREVFAKDTAVEQQHLDKTPEITVTPTEVISPPPLQELPKKEKKQKENCGFLSLFRRKKKAQTEGTRSAPASPGLKAGVSANVAASSQTLSAEMPKKRRAPQPPMGGSRSIPHSLTSCQRSAESTLRSTKRRAPAPPCANNHQEVEPHTDAKGTPYSLHPLSNLRDSGESDSITLSFSSSSSPRPPRSRSSSSFSHPSLSRFHEVADHLPSLRGRDLSDARAALAKVLTSSVSKGALVTRLRSAATLPKLRSPNFVSVHRRHSENGAICKDLDRDLPTNLPVEPEWEDPIQRRAMTTFKVVPSKKQRSTDSEMVLKVPEEIQIEKAPEEEASLEIREEPRMKTSSASSGNSSEEPKSPLCPFDSDGNLDCRSSSPSEVVETIERDEEEAEEGEVIKEEAAEEEEPEAVLEVDQAETELPGSFEDQNDLVESETDHCSTNAPEEDIEEEVEDFFPPPPPPVFFNEDVEVVEDQREATTASPQPPHLTSNGLVHLSNGPTSSSPYRSPTEEEEEIATPSRFAQAVALAVQRSRTQSQGKSFVLAAPSSPHSTLPSSPRSIYQYGA
ncbi:uncharacterized protein LOC141786029 isoform X2 [Halichoeres trimaculatus]|uniref:uncharacterized protein LOC141786029 isoform X2 n=1 Tax=Halichoeres trimaculatus TaxID=147232 RepID=UPI003D9E5941